MIMHEKEFPREPISQNGTSSIFLLKISPWSSATPISSSSQKSHQKIISWVLNDEGSAWIDVNGCPDPYATLWSWIEHLQIYGHENLL